MCSISTIVDISTDGVIIVGRVVTISTSAIVTAINIITNTVGTIRAVVTTESGITFINIEALDAVTNVTWFVTLTAVKWYFVGTSSPGVAVIVTVSGTFVNILTTVFFIGGGTLEAV